MANTYETIRGNEAKYVTFWTDNPVHDAEAYSAAGDQWLEEHAPECEECGRKIYDSTCVVLEGACICNDCRQKLIRWTRHQSRYLADIVDDLLSNLVDDTPMDE